MNNPFILIRHVAIFTSFLLVSSLLPVKSHAQQITSVTKNRESVNSLGGTLAVSLSIAGASPDFSLQVLKIEQHVDILLIPGCKVNMDIISNYTIDNPSYTLNINIKPNPCRSILRGHLCFTTNAGIFKVEFSQSSYDKTMPGLLAFNLIENYDHLAVFNGYWMVIKNLVPPNLNDPNFSGQWMTVKDDGTLQPVRDQSGPDSLVYYFTKDVRICYQVKRNGGWSQTSNIMSLRVPNPSDYDEFRISSSLKEVPYNGKSQVKIDYYPPVIDNIVFEWQKKERAGAWGKVADYREVIEVSNLIRDTYFRVAITRKNQTVYSNEVLIHVVQPEGGDITCSDLPVSSGQKFKISSSISHATGTYRWEKRADASSAWEEIPGQQGAECENLSVIDDTWFRRKITTSSDVFYSNELLVYTTPYQKVEEIEYLEATTRVPSAGKRSDIIFQDGFGQTVQVVQVKASPQGNTDLIYPHVYGVFGRVEKEYLPYAKNGNNGLYDANALTATNWSLLGSGEQAHAFTRNSYDNSPLNRVMKQVGPGKAWHDGDKGTMISYQTNTANQVKAWNVGANGELLSGNLYYPTGVLSRVITTDEDNKVSEVFTDREGRTLLSVVVMDGVRLETYYVYDDIGLLRYVLSPEASTRVGITATRTTDVICKYAYYYAHDRSERTILKQLPGCDPVYLVYDARNRLTMSQDGNQRASNAGRWSYTHYDGLDRVTETGEVVLTGATSHSDLQEMASVSTNFTPAGTKTVLQYTTYDTYPTSGTVISLAFQGKSDYSTTCTSLVTGLATNVKTRAIGTEQWSTLTIYYDDRSRVIQTVSDNSLGFTSRVDIKYDFVGNVVKTRESHGYSATGNDVLETTNEYDTRGRLLTTTSVLNDGTPATIKHEYDAIGRLVTKRYKLATNDLPETLTYNSRGWLTGKSSTAFRMALRYETTVLGTSGKPCYNGNIGEWEWQHGNNPALMYLYAYDDMNRLTGSVHYQKGGSWLALTDGNNHDERGLAYDGNGNILGLTRTGGTSATLSYVYTGNQLTGLTKNGVVGSYGYDRNGNLINDSRKNLNIEYNVLNLVSAVKAGTTTRAKYDYLADGTKSRVADGAGNGFYYSGSLTYKKSSAGLQLEGASFGDGRIVANGSNRAQSEVNYFLTDHLGSVRVIVDGAGAVKERNDYYAFGTRHVRSDYPKSDNRLKYNSKEEQVTGDLDYLDYGARMYDSGLGRWFGMDPLAEEYSSWSSYNYCLNDPLRFIDPDGSFVSTHTDWAGNVIAVYNDGDLGIYRHRDEDLKDWNPFELSLTSTGAEKMGETLEWNSFLLNGDIEKGVLGKIDFNSFEALNSITNSLLFMLGQTDGKGGATLLMHYASRANNGEWYDLKAKGGRKGDISYYYRGSQLFPGVYVSARDAGNLLAGMVARSAGLSASSTYTIFGALQLSGNERWKTPFLLNNASWLGLIGTYGELPVSHAFQKRGYELNF